MEMLSSVISPGNAGRRRAAILILCAIVLDVLEAPASDMKRERSWRCWAAEADSDNANTGATRRARDFHMTPISELLCQCVVRLICSESTRKSETHYRTMSEHYYLAA